MKWLLTGGLFVSRLQYLISLNFFFMVLVSVTLNRRSREQVRVNDTYIHMLTLKQKTASWDNGLYFSAD